MGFRVVIEEASSVSRRLFFEDVPWYKGVDGRNYEGRPVIEEGLVKTEIWGCTRLEDEFLARKKYTS